MKKYIYKLSKSTQNLVGFGFRWIQPVEIAAHVQLLDFNASREVRAHANLRCQLKNDYFKK